MTNNTQAKCALTAPSETDGALTWELPPELVRRIESMAPGDRTVLEIALKGVMAQHMLVLRLLVEAPESSVVELLCTAMTITEEFGAAAKTILRQTAVEILRSMPLHS